MRNLYHIHVVLTVKKQPFKFVYVNNGVIHIYTKKQNVYFVV